jgi:hypothetical protein
VIRNAKNNGKYRGLRPKFTVFSKGAVANIRALKAYNQADSA